MSDSRQRINRRAIRKALGQDAFDLIEQHDIRLRAHAAILRRKLFGRLWWLLTGR